MQLMTFNSLLMFDIVFIFFLFLIVVTCLLYYLPPVKIRPKSQLDKRRSQQSVTVSSSNSSKSALYANGDNEPVESFIRCCKYCEKCKLIYEEVYSERRYADDEGTSQQAMATSSGSYLKAKDCDIKNCKGPIYEVMYSSFETPSTSSGSHPNQYQYHSNAFTMHSTANSITSTTGAPKLAPASNGSVKSTTRPFTDAHLQQSSTIFNNINSNRSKYGAYNSTCSNNNFEDVKHNIRTTTLNEKIIPRGPYLQYKMSENDNKSNYLQPNYFFKPTPKPDNSHIINVQVLKEDFVGRGVLPRAKIMSNSVLDASGVDYNLRTQTIGRYHPVQPVAAATHPLKKPLQSGTPLNVTGAKPQNVGQKQIAFSCHTLPVTRRENQQKDMMSGRLGGNLNYITLESALNVKTVHQLTPTQGWALLCQSVQALQDLFLSETPSINRVLPVITPKNFLLTSRGRVVYGLLTIDKHNDCTNEYLSDEFRQALSGKVLKQNESDIEKMWIYSLGRTLSQTMPTVLPTSLNENSMQQQHHSSIVLQATIWKMCKCVEERASLMFLLNIISDYCKNVHQVQPFSHIMMELFKKLVNDPNFNSAPTVDEQQQNTQPRNAVVNGDGHKSDTDSGRSSDYRSDDNSLQKKLATMEEEPVKYFSLPRPKYNRKPEKTIEEEPPKVKLRANAENFRQRRVGGRRFTVDVAATDVDMALNDVGLHRQLSRSISALNRPATGEYNLKSVSRGTQLEKQSIIEEDESERPKGPEFIVNSIAEVKFIDICDNKSSCKGNVSVLLLNGRNYNLICNPLGATTRMVFESIIKAEQIHENYILGICALIGGDFVFLPPDLKIYKVAPQVWIQSATKKSSDEIKSPVFSLYLRVKLFLPTLRIVSPESRHTLFLQLRKSILENHIVCTDDDLITLGGLALQAEVGDFQDDMKNIEYFTISHYLPDGVYQQNKELGKYLRNSHFSKRGLHPKEAELNFIRYVQEMQEYGLHYISGVWTRDDKIELNVYIGIGLNGIKLFERKSSATAVKRSHDRKSSKRLMYDEFDWLEIENICFSKQILCIVVRKSNLRLNLGSKEKTRLKFKLKMDSRKSFFAFTIASDHHQFYMKLRNSFVSIKSIADELNVPIAEESFSQSNFNIKVDKPTKSSGLRVRNLKKSMLNDHRLLKLKDRFIRRSKSTVCDFKRSTEENSNDNNQNKENERPTFPSMIDLSVKSPTTTRNKVKMGTRVFSASYLNKSFDSLSENQAELTRVDSWGALCMNSPKREAFDETAEDEKEIETSKDKNDAYVIDSSIKSAPNGNNFSMRNETMSQSLLQKFEDISCTDDRVLSQISIVKDPVFSDKLNFKSQSLRSIANVDSFITGYTMGISIIQGQSDNYVYVKELVKNGPGDRSGICVGDQIVSVDGTSLLNMPYDDALAMLQGTGSIVTLIVSQVFARKPLNESSETIALVQGTPVKSSPKTNLISTPSKSLPNLLNSRDYQLPKIVAIIPKENIGFIPKENKSRSRKYLGPMKFPVTPGRKEKDLKMTISPNSQKTHLSLPTNEDDTLNI